MGEKGMAAPLKPDLRILMPAMLDSVKQLEKIYGPVFSKMTVRFAVEFEAKKIGDQAPPAIETLQDCAKYIMQNTDKYPDGISSIVYGSCKAENALQGGIGSGGRTSTKQGMKEINVQTGAASAYSKTANTTEVCRMQLDLAKKMGIMVGETQLSGDENSVTVAYERCRFADACKAILQEGIRRVGGGLECTNARAGTSSIELATGLAHDFDVVTFDPPHCVFRIFKV
ncbi:MAG: hypothetical protein WED04_13090 [Promethearchaeati archaeon SRVP18_Atabeyarchaeia-1]